MQVFGLRLNHISEGEVYGKGNKINILIHQDNAIKQEIIFLRTKKYMNNVENCMANLRKHHHM